MEEPKEIYQCNGEMAIVGSGEIELHAAVRTVAAWLGQAAFYSVLLTERQAVLYPHRCFHNPDMGPETRNLPIPLDVKEAGDLLWTWRSGQLPTYLVGDPEVLRDPDPDCARPSDWISKMSLLSTPLRAVSILLPARQELNLRHVPQPATYSAEPDPDRQRVRWKDPLGDPLIPGWKVDAVGFGHYGIAARPVWMRHSATGHGHYERFIAQERARLNY